MEKHEGEARNESEGKRSQICALLGMLTAAALLCSYIESLFPIPLGLPGIKLGIANLAAVLALYLLGDREALLIQTARILLAGFLFGNLAGILYSLAGGLLSLAVMALLKKCFRMSLLSVSVAGGISHNFGQVLVAAIVVENLNLLYYMSALFFAGLTTGAVIGILAIEVRKRLKGWREK